MKFVLLFRGVNVGGYKRVPKAEFKAVLEDLGFDEVIIYLNSGNAVFSSSHEVDATKLQAAFENHFGFEIPCLVLSSKKITKIANSIPDKWTNDSPSLDKIGQKSDVLYLFEKIDNPKILDALGYDPKIEQMIYVPGAVLVNITRANQSKGSLHKIVGTKLYAQMTIRNVNTARKLAELVT